MVDDPKLVTEKQMEEWVKDFDSWDICDLCCSNPFDKTDYAYKKALEWSSGRDEEYAKRAGFVLIATLAVHDKKEKDSAFLNFLSIIKQECLEDRNFVKKAVNWALRQIGKRSIRLNREAIRAARHIQKINSKGARWIASDALRELRSQVTQTRLKDRRKNRASYSGKSRFSLPLLFLF